MEISERTKVWFGDKTREELLVEIDRIITTDRPALAKLYEELDALRAKVAEGVMRVDEPGFSVQTGPGRIVLGAFAAAGGRGVPADRVCESEEVAGPPVPIRLLPPAGPWNLPRIKYTHRNGYFRQEPNWPKAPYVDPEQIASRTRVWPDEAA